MLKKESVRGDDGEPAAKRAKPEEGEVRTEKKASNDTNDKVALLVNLETIYKG